MQNVHISDCSCVFFSCSPEVRGQMSQIEPAPLPLPRLFPSLSKAWECRNTHQSFWVTGRSVCDIVGTCIVCVQTQEFLCPDKGTLSAAVCLVRHYLLLPIPAHTPSFKEGKIALLSPSFFFKVPSLSLSSLPEYLPILFFFWGGVYVKMRVCFFIRVPWTHVYCFVLTSSMLHELANDEITNWTQMDSYL